LPSLRAARRRHGRGGKKGWVPARVTPWRQRPPPAAPPKHVHLEVSARGGRRPCAQRHGRQPSGRRRRRRGGCGWFGSTVGAAGRIPLAPAVWSMAARRADVVSVGEGVRGEAKGRQRGWGVRRGGCHSRSVGGGHREGRELAAFAVGGFHRSGRQRWGLTRHGGAGLGSWGEEGMARVGGGGGDRWGRYESAALAPMGGASGCRQ